MTTKNKISTVRDSIHWRMNFPENRLQSSHGRWNVNQLSSLSLLYLNLANNALERFCPIQLHFEDSVVLGSAEKDGLKWLHGHSRIHTFSCVILDPA
jgi:hypothetical protein